MSFWPAVIWASLASMGIKLAGYLIPVGWVQHPRIVRISTLLPAALLGALVVVQTFAQGKHFTLDARIAGVAAAAVAYKLKAPFIVAVIVAAVVSALLRLAGWD